MKGQAKKSALRTNLWRMFLGAIAGAVGMSLFLALIGDRVELGDPETIIALIGGVSYAITGLAVGFGIVAPRTGAHFLNVEDAEELREERPVLRIGAATCFLIGLFLIVLTLAGGPDSLIGREIALVVALGSIAAIAILSVMVNKRTDELTRRISLESSALTFHVALVFFGGWAVLAHLGYVAWVSPLAFVAILAMLLFVVTLAVGASKGLITPR